MSEIKNLLTKVLDECTTIKNENGDGKAAVIRHVILEQENNNPDYDQVKYRKCPHCDEGLPNLLDTCLVCGKDTNVQKNIATLDLTYGVKIRTVGELRNVMSELSDDDIIYIETCDAKGNAQDLFPMYVDVIDGIELKNGSVVNEVRFCQMPNNDDFILEERTDDYDDFINDEELLSKNKSLSDHHSIDPDHDWNGCDPSEWKS